MGLPAERASCTIRTCVKARVMRLQYPPEFVGNASDGGYIGKSQSLVSLSTFKVVTADIIEKTKIRNTIQFNLQIQYLSISLFKRALRTI